MPSLSVENLLCRPLHVQAIQGHEERNTLQNSLEKVIVSGSVGKTGSTGFWLL